VSLSALSAGCSWHNWYSDNSVFLEDLGIYLRPGV